MKKKVAATPEHHVTVRLEDSPRLKGSRLPETTQLLAARDELLRQAVHTFCHDLRDRKSAADHISRAAISYQASAWLRERQLATCPERRVGKLEGVFWRILQFQCIPGASRLRRIISK